MPKALKEIEITHISLVKAGANEKTLIYKSKDETPAYDRVCKIVKSDEKEGVIYGIVYAPDEEDSQGDFASADEIKKAAYNFMKAARTRNVDKDHDFEPKEAYVAESWLIKKGDAIFPEEKEGAWAAAIKLESEELKEAVKKGEIAGLSMAGKAVREEVAKADESAKNLLDALTSAMKEIWIEIRGSVVKNNSKKKGEIMDETEVKKAVETALEPIAKELETLKSENEALKKQIGELNAELSKSKQNEDVKKASEKSKFEGVL